MIFIKKNWVIIFLMLVQFISLLFYIGRSNANIIYSDQFYTVDLVVRKVYEKNFNLFSTLLNVWNKGGIHRGVGGVLITLLNLKYFKLNTLFEIYLLPVILLITVLILYKYYIRNLAMNKVFPKTFFLLISFIVFSLDQEELLTFGNGLYLIIRMFLFILIFINFENFIKKRTKINLFQFAVLFFANLFLFSAGYTIPFIFTLVSISICHLIIDKSFKKNINYFWITIIIFFLSLFIYLNRIFQVTSYRNLGTTRNFISIININQIIPFLKFSLLSLSSNIINVNYFNNHKSFIQDSFLIITALILLASYLIAVYYFFSKRIFKKTYIPLFFIIYAFLIYISIAITRYGFVKEFPYYAMSSRYTLDTHYGLIGIIWIFSYLLFDNRSVKLLTDRIKYKFIPILILIFILTGQVLTYTEEWRIGPYRKNYFNNLRKISLEEDYNNKSEMKLFQNPNPKLVIDSLKFLKKYKLNVFSK